MVVEKKKNATYKFSNTQLHIHSKWSKKFLDLGKENIAEEDVYKDPEDSRLGREDDIHVTVLYGIDIDGGLEEVRELLNDQEDFEIEIGKVSIFSGKESGKERPYDVVKFEISSPSLQKLHRKIRDNVSNQYSWPTYNPHLTIAYVKEGKGDQYVGEVDGLTGEKILASTLIYSGADGSREKIHFEKSKKD